MAFINKTLKYGGNTYMALNKCEECGGTLSDKAFFCPHCGLPMGDPAHFFCYPDFLFIRDFLEVNSGLNKATIKPTFGRCCDSAKIALSGHYKGREPNSYSKMDLLDKYFKVIGTAKLENFPTIRASNKSVERRITLNFFCFINGEPVDYFALDECRYIINCKCGKDRHYISPSREVNCTPEEDDDF